MAIAALVVGIIAAVGILCYGIPAVILGPIALYLGLRAGRRIKASGGTIGGAGLAMAGWIIGLVAICAGAVFVILTVGVFVLTATTGHPDITITPGR